MSDNNFISPTKTARGLGSSKSGTSHHIRQRVSAIALLFLVPWFIYAIMTASGMDWASAREWAGKPHNALLLMLTAGAAIYHMCLGMQVIIEDYIYTPGMKGFLLILNRFACIALFAAFALSVLKLWIGADA